MGATLEDAVKARDMTIHQLAQAAGVPYATVYDVVTGRRPVGGMATRNAVAVAQALGMSVEELMGSAPPTLTADEARLLDVFRNVPPFAQKMAIRMVENIAEGLADE